MNLKKLLTVVLSASSLCVAISAFSSAQAATLGGSTTCESSSFSYLDCAGAFSGNDKGAQGTAISNLNSLFGGDWSFVGDSEDGTVMFSSGGDGTKSGTALTSLNGLGAIAVKAGPSYSLYTVADLSEFDWDTFGVTPVGSKGNNAPGLSHLSIYKQATSNPPSKEVPEPGILFGLVMMTGIGTRLYQKKEK